MKAGGNAADAAVAVAAAMSLTQPTTNGLGGDAFIMFYDARRKQVRGINGSGRAPAALTLQKLQEDGFGPANPVPRQHGHSVTVPGAVAAWVDAYTNFGSGQLTLQQILDPAINLGQNGFPVSQMTSGAWQRSERLLKDPRNTHGGDMLINGNAPKWGEVFKNQNHANTLRAIAQFGKTAFYEGRIAQAIVDAVRRFGGVMTLDDLKNHTSTMDDPISVTYGGYRLWEMPPNCQGIVALMALNIVETYNLKEMGHNSVDYMHHLIEALKLSFTDGRYYVADPSKVSVPTAGMIDKNYAATRRALINSNMAMTSASVGTPPGASGPPADVLPSPEGEDTIYFTVSDREGNAVSWIQSNYAGMGTGIVPQGCGFTLQNRGNNFSYEAAHPNVIAPNKRPYHTIIPAMITTDSGELLASYGVMGGFMQPQGHLQVFMNMAVFGMDPQQALDSPRFRVATSSRNIYGRVTVEEGIPQSVIDGLTSKGHTIPTPSTGRSRVGYGRGHAITKGAWWKPEDRTDTANDPGVWWAGSDPRADGLAIGY